MARARAARGDRSADSKARTVGPAGMSIMLKRSARFVDRCAVVRDVRTGPRRWPASVNRLGHGFDQGRGRPRRVVSAHYGGVRGGRD